MERVIAGYIEQCSKDESENYEEILKRDNRVAINYYLGKTAAGFIAWYPFSKCKRILQIGSNFGSYSNFLMKFCDELIVLEPDALRYKAVTIRFSEDIALGKLIVIQKKLREYDIEERFDYIVFSPDEAIGEFNSYEEYEYAFQQTIRLLNIENENARLLCVVPNKLGTMYLAGKTNRSGEYFTGITKEWYSIKTETYRMDRAELILLLEKYFSKFKLFYPYQDQHITDMVYTDEFPPNNEIFERLGSYTDFQKTALVDDYQMMKVLEPNVNLNVFANAFIIEASPMEKVEMSNVMYSTITLQRDNTRCFATNMCNDGSVIKLALAEEGKDSLFNLKQNLMELHSRGINALSISLTEYGAKMKYMKCGSLAKYIRQLVKDNDIEALYYTLDKIYSLILKSSDCVLPDENQFLYMGPHLAWGPILKKAFIEMIPVNCFYDEKAPQDDKFIFYDQEFIYKNCPAKYVLYRVTKDIYIYNPDFDKILPWTEILSHYEIDEKLREKFQIIENNFQSKLRQHDVFSGQLHWLQKGNLAANRQRFSRELKRRMILKKAGKFNGDDCTEEYQSGNIFADLNERKVVLFGAGKQADYYLERYGNIYRCKPVYIIDNSPEKWGRTKAGIPIISFDDYLKLPDFAYQIFICVGDYKAIETQLREYGILDYRIFTKSLDNRYRLQIRNFRYIKKDEGKLVLFGSGRRAEKYMQQMGESFYPDIVVDNNEKKWNQYFYNILITSPAVLSKMVADGENVHVVIAVVQYEEIMQQLLEMGISENQIVVYKNDYLKIINMGDARDNIVDGKYKVGYLPGAFDMFHIGHLNILKRCKEVCHYLIAGVISDEISLKDKGKKPVIPQEERMEIVRQCRYVDEVVLIDEHNTDKLKALRELKFDCMFSGSDHDYSWLRKEFRKFGSDVLIFPYTEHISSSKLREKLSKKE